MAKSKPTNMVLSPVNKLIFEKNVPPFSLANISSVMTCISLNKEIRSYFLGGKKSNTEKQSSCIE